tara:strand:- start:129 stop:659 length:531 start_codon:yes stop_codon:yes gene_type:complete
MAHFAEIKNSDNSVLRIVVVDNADVDANGGDYSVGAETWVTSNVVKDPEILAQGSYPTTYWKQTSYNNNARYNYAGPGNTYDSTNDAFIDPKPFPSWILDSSFVWVAPVADPSTFEVDGVPVIIASWDEANTKWFGWKNEDPYPEYAWNNSTSIWEATGENRPTSYGVKYTGKWNG